MIYFYTTKLINYLKLNFYIKYILIPRNSDFSILRCENCDELDRFTFLDGLEIVNSA